MLTKLAVEEIQRATQSMWTLISLVYVSLSKATYFENKLEDDCPDRHNNFYHLPRHVYLKDMVGKRQEVSVREGSTKMFFYKEV